MTALATVTVLALRPHRRQSSCQGFARPGQLLCRTFGRHADGVSTARGHGTRLRGDHLLRPDQLPFPNSAHIVMVEIDRETREVKLPHYTSVDDVSSRIASRRHRRTTHWWSRAPVKWVVDHIFFGHFQLEGRHLVCRRRGLRRVAEATHSSWKSLSSSPLL